MRPVVDVRNEMLSVLQSSLAEYRPTKKRASMYARFVNTMVIINLQKSQWGPQLYLNVSAIFDIEDRSDLLRWPSESTGDIRMRLDHLLCDRDQAKLNTLLDLGAAMSTAERLASLGEIASAHLLPIVRSLSTAEGRAALARGGLLSSAFMTRRARELLTRI